MDSILINDSKTLKEIQDAFSNHFPNLKIEFYDEAHDDHEGSPKDHLLDASKTIGEVRKKHNTGEISIHGNQKVSTLEAHFEDNFGLHVQVHRNSNGVWLQTIQTDDWTLSEQNNRARV